MKKLTGLLLASSLAMSLAVPFSSMANEEYTISQDVDIQGTIKESPFYLRITIPLTADFVVETVTGEGVVSNGAPLKVGTLVNGNDAVICPSYTIENNSSMGVSIDIVAVKDNNRLLDDIQIALSENGAMSTSYLNIGVSATNSIELMELPKVGTSTFKVIGHEVLLKDEDNNTARKIVTDGPKIITTTLRVTPVW